MKNTKKPAKKPRGKGRRTKKPRGKGRPTLYTLEMAEKICDAIAGSEKSLDTICRKNLDFPKERTIRTWRREKKDFQHMYALAKEDQGDLYAEKTIEIADDSKHDTIIKTDRHGNEYEAENHEWVNRSRLRVQARQWAAARLRPKVYGDKIQTETTQSIKTAQDIISIYKTMTEEERLLIIDALSKAENVEEETTEST